MIGVKSCVARAHLLVGVSRPVYPDGLLPCAVGSSINHIREPDTNMMQSYNMTHLTTTTIYLLYPSAYLKIWSSKVSSRFARENTL
jgi:hypothetical protein